MKHLVGKYQLGCYMVNLYLEQGLNGASFRTIGSNNGLAEISLDVADSPSEVVSALLHEAFELTISLLNGRVQPDYTTSESTDRYRFMFDHAQFSETCSRVGSFIVKCVPDILNILAELGTSDDRLQKTARSAKTSKSRKARSSRKTATTTKP